MLQGLSRAEFCNQNLPHLRVKGQVETCTHDGDTEIFLVDSSGGNCVCPSRNLDGCSKMTKETLIERVDQLGLVDRRTNSAGSEGVGCVFVGFDKGFDESSSVIPVAGNADNEAGSAGLPK